MPNIIIKECSNLESISSLFGEHLDEPFVYPGDLYLFRLFSHSKTFRALVAEVNDRVVGCVYAMRYMYGYGWIGGLLTHKQFRRMSIAKSLLKKVLRFLRPSYAFLFVEPENVAAKNLVESLGFREVYRRMNGVIDAPLRDSDDKISDISYDVEWDNLVASIGFRKRKGIVNIGYYPIKLTNHVFNDLRTKRKILKCGDIIAVVESSYSVDINNFTFTFNDYILKEASVCSNKRIIEVNPFYVKAQSLDSIKLINHLSTNRQVAVWTYCEDPILRDLPIKKMQGALVMELCTH